MLADLHAQNADAVVADVGDVADVAVADVADVADVAVATAPAPMARWPSLSMQALYGSAHPTCTNFCTCSFIATDGISHGSQLGHAPSCRLFTGFPLRDLTLWIIFDGRGRCSMGPAEILMASPLVIDFGL